MSTRMQQRRGHGPPDVSDLVEGEIAIDMDNQRLYYRDADSLVHPLGADPTVRTTVPDDPADGESVHYQRGPYLIWKYNDGGTMRYHYFDLTSTAASQELQYKDHDPNDFDPSDLVPAVWCRAEDVVGLSDGDPVATWEDISGNNRDGTASVGNQPTWEDAELNGYPVLRFNDTTDVMSFGDLSAVFPTAATLIVVVKLNGSSSYGGYNTQYVPDFDGWWRYTDGTAFLRVFRNPRTSATPASMPSTGAHVFIITSDSSNHKVYDNGSLIGTSSAAYSAGTSHKIAPDAAGSNPAPDHAEFLLVDRVITSDEITNATAFFRDKYGF